MGTFAERGIGEPSGLEAAVEHYRQAAEKGEVRAMTRLAELYRTGRGVARDEEQSRQWREKAAQARAAQAP